MAPNNPYITIEVARALVDHLFAQKRAGKNLDQVVDEMNTWFGQRLAQDFRTDPNWRQNSNGNWIIRIRDTTVVVCKDNKSKWNYVVYQDGLEGPIHRGHEPSEYIDFAMKQAYSYYRFLVNPGF